MSAQIWDEETQGPQPHLCAGCTRGDCQAHDEFFNAEHDGILYGLFNCECLCDPANLEAMLRDTPDEA